MAWRVKPVLVVMERGVQRYGVVALYGICRVDAFGVEVEHSRYGLVGNDGNALQADARQALVVGEEGEEGGVVLEVLTVVVNGVVDRLQAVGDVGGAVAVPGYVRAAVDGVLLLYAGYAHLVVGRTVMTGVINSNLFGCLPYLHHLEAGAGAVGGTCVLENIGKVDGVGLAGGILLSCVEVYEVVVVPDVFVISLLSVVDEVTAEVYAVRTFRYVFVAFETDRYQQVGSDDTVDVGEHVSVLLAVGGGDDHRDKVGIVASKGVITGMLDVVYAIDGDTVYAAVGEVYAYVAVAYTCMNGYER